MTEKHNIFAGFFISLFFGENIQCHNIIHLYIFPFNIILNNASKPNQHHCLYNIIAEVWEALFVP